jgi:hypothetical protein
VKRLALTLALSLLAGCTRPAPCPEPLFGRPVAQTGLSAEQCQPSCGACTTPVLPTEWTAERLAALRGWTLETPFAEVAQDPYAADAGARPEGVCAIVVTDAAARRYRAETFADQAAAKTAGAFLTHHGACGVCSTLADLWVYASNPDLGAPVKQCGVDTFGQGFLANVQCLEALGFTLPCAQIWAWNTANTRAQCLDPCVRFGGESYHSPDGGLNACLACDEQKSGPVFKAVAGRTRRNTGIPSAICRPCNEAQPVAHDYP